MLNLVKIISTVIDSLSRRKVKFLRFGNNDVQDVIQAAPYGNDSNPIADMVAVYGSTEEKGKAVIIGYLNVNQIADVGEHRTFATDSDGNVVFSIHQKNDGTCEIGGNTDFMVRFSNLEAGFNELKSDVNSHISDWNTFATAYVPGGPTPVGTPPTASTSTPTTADISGAKIDEIKTL